VRWWRWGREQGSQGRRPGGRAVHDFPAGSAFFCKPAIFPAASAPIRSPTRRNCFGQFTAVCSAIRIFLADMRAGRPNICVFRMPTSARSSPDGLTDEQVLFLSDIFPTGYMGAEFCDIKRRRTIAVWGCGVFSGRSISIRSAFLLGAARVDRDRHGTGNAWRWRVRPEPRRWIFKKRDIYERIHGADQGTRRGCLHRRVGTGRTPREPRLGRGSREGRDFQGTDRPHVLRQAIHCCRNFGTVRSSASMAASSTRSDGFPRSIAA